MLRILVALLALTSVPASEQVVQPAPEPEAQPAANPVPRELLEATAPADDFVPTMDLHDGWYARIETDRGRIVAQLLPEQAPQSVAHFAALAEGRLPWTDPVSGETRHEPYYDGVPIYKAEAGRVIESGDRHGTGNGAPTMYVPLEGAGPIHFGASGRLGMTRAAGGKISGVQFFVTYAAQPWLTGRHPCFGVVVEGREVVFALSSVKTYSNGRPIEPLLIRSIRIFSVGDVAPLPEPVVYWPAPSTYGLRKQTTP